MKKYFILAAAVVAMAACNNDERENVVKSDNNISLTASVSGATATRGGVAVQSTAFEDGAEINVECTPTGGTLASAVYVAGTPTGTVNDLTLKANETPLRWPASGTVNIDAYYPSTVTSEVTSFSVQTDQSLDDNYKLSDLMYATNISAQTKQSTAVELTFNHALTKIIVNLSAGDGVSAADITGCTVTLSAQKTVDITKGVAGTTTSNAATITAGTGAATAAIIVPQTIDGSTTPQNFITVTTAGSHSGTYQLNSQKAFLAGKVYTYNLTVGMAEITLQSLVISDWEAGDTTTPASPLII